MTETGKEKMLKKSAGKPSRSTPKKLTEAFLAAVRDVAQKHSQSETSDFSLHAVNPVHILIAYSGGRDSSALLHTAAKCFHKAGQSEIASVTAVYINHGLSKNAEDWAEHCRTESARLRLPFRAETVYVPKTSPDGIEAAARQARYRALFRIAREIRADAIFTAHHLDDQLETFLIQWMRGAGLDGLSGLATSRPLTPSASDGVMLCRPWLSITRNEINTYAARSHLNFIEDESNGDNRFLRNLIRNDVFPILEQARPGWKEAAFRSVGLIAQASHVLKELSIEDTQTALADDGKALSIEKLRRLAPERQALVVRHWLAEGGIRFPNKAKLEETLRQIRESCTDTKLAIRFESKEMRRWGDKLILTDSTVKRHCDALEVALHWNGEKRLSIPAWNGVLCFEQCAASEPGFDAELLKKGTLRIRARQGGEKLKLHPFRPSRNLKHLYQAADIPSFEREKLPLVWLNETLLFAAGLGADVRLYADAELIQNRIRFVWIPDKSLLD